MADEGPRSERRQTAKPGGATADRHSRDQRSAPRGRFPAPKPQKAPKPLSGREFNDGLRKGGVDPDRPVTPDTLRQAVGERDYQRRRDPGLFAGVAAGFRSLFPGDVARDATGRMKDTKPRPGVTFRSVLGELGIGSLDAAQRAGRRKAAATAPGTITGGESNGTLVGQGTDDTLLRSLEPQRRPPAPRFPDEAVGDAASQRRGVPLWGPWYGADVFVPSEKTELFERPVNAGAMENFRDALKQELADASLVESLAHQLAYAWEGGEIAKHVGTEDEVIGGVTVTTVERLGDELGMDFAVSGTPPTELSLAQRVQAYRGHQEDILARTARSFSEEEGREIAGRELLDRVGDPFAAIALSDTLFRHGLAEGPLVLQRAINDVQRNVGRPPEELVEVDGGMGRETFDAYARLAQDPATRDKLLDQVAKWRKIEKDSGGDIDRAEFFRFTEWR